MADFHGEWGAQQDALAQAERARDTLLAPVKAAYKEAEATVRAACLDERDTLKTDHGSVTYVSPRLVAQVTDNTLMLEWMRLDTTAAALVVNKISFELDAAVVDRIIKVKPGLTRFIALSEEPSTPRVKLLVQAS